VFKPVNRYLVVETPTPPAETKSGIVLPDDYKPAEDPWVVVKLIDYADDVRFGKKLKNLSAIHEVSLLVERSMIEQIVYNGTNYSLILDNYVKGAFTK